MNAGSDPERRWRNGKNIEILKLRVMLCLLKSDAASSTVTGMSRTLNKEKYVISRIMAGLEKEGLLDRSDPRNPG